MRQEVQAPPFRAPARQEQQASLDDFTKGLMNAEILPGLESGIYKSPEQQSMGGRGKAVDKVSKERKIAKVESSTILGSLTESVVLSPEVGSRKRCMKPVRDQLCTSGSWASELFNRTHGFGISVQNTLTPEPPAGF